jgi:Lysyl-tRNA synthetase (class II)
MRYLDMLWNDKTRQILWQRSRMVRFIRECTYCNALEKVWYTNCGQSSISVASLRLRLR